MTNAAVPLPRWNLAPGSPIAHAVERDCAVLLAGLRAGSAAARLAFLCDTRAAHARIFARCAPPDLPEAAGTYRGTAGSPLEGARRAVFSARRLPGLKMRDMCSPPEAVGAEVEALAARLRADWASPPTGAARFDALAAMTAAFLRTHPYLDGNGHIYRVMAVVLAERFGLSIAPTWTIGARPYDHHMSLCLQWYPHHPALLSAYLRCWFGVAD